MISDQNLLEDFARSGSESAFRQLVDRHLDLVHSVARRVTLNDDLARDVAQAVFVKLATRPDSVPKGIKLLAWLHRTTRHKAIDLVRSENRRRRREQIAITTQQDEMETSTDDELDWKELEPVIDAALAKLPANDRALVLARYYQKRSHAETAEHLGITEDAARMRTKRALGKLRTVLGKRGIAASATLLGTAVAANAVSPAPAALSAAVCKSGLAAAAASSGTGVGATATTLTMLKANLAAVAAVAIGVPVVALQYSDNQRLERDIEAIKVRLESRGTIAKDAEPQDAPPSASIASDLSLLQILANPDPVVRLDSLLAHINEVKTESIHGALVALRENTASWDPDARIAGRMLLARWAKADPDAAFDYVEGIDYRQGAGDIFVVLDALTASDPQRSVDWLNDPENKLAYLPTMTEKLAGNIAKEWVRQDPFAAFEWAKNAPGDRRMGALNALFDSLASEPGRATTLAMELPTGSERSQIIGKIAENWSRRSPQQAIAWAESLDGGEQQSGLDRALAGWSWTAPAEAATYVDAMPTNERSASFVQTIAESWARQEPAQAAAWVASQEESDAKTSAMGHVMWNWTVAAPEIASTWLLEQPSGASRDNGIDCLARATFPENPSGAASWAAAIDNPGSRRRALDRTVRKWLESEPAAAREWLNTTEAIAADETARYLSEAPSE